MNRKNEAGLEMARGNLEGQENGEGRE